jgi:hypothetical protein
LLDAKRAEELKLEEIQRAKLAAEAKPAARKKQRSETDPDPFLGHNVERKLHIGLELALTLAKNIHTTVQNSAPLATEPGCEGDLDTTYEPANSSFLLSVLRQLAPCPGRTGTHQWWMTKDAVRLHKTQLQAVPPEGSAPEAVETCRMHPLDAGHGDRDGAAPPVDVLGVASDVVGTDAAADPPVDVGSHAAADHDCRLDSDQNTEDPKVCVAGW